MSFFEQSILRADTDQHSWSKFAVEIDRSGWTTRLGFSLHEGLRQVLIRVEADANKINSILQLTTNRIDNIASTNDLVLGEDGGYQFAAVLNSDTSPLNRQGLQLAVRTPKREVVFVSLTGDRQKSFQYIGRSVDGNLDSSWWKASEQWLNRLRAIPNVNTASDFRQFYNENPRIAPPHAFWNGIEALPSTITNLVVQAVAQAYKMPINEQGRRPARKSRTKERKEQLDAVTRVIKQSFVEFLQPVLAVGLERQIQKWRDEIQLGTPEAKEQIAARYHSYGVIRYFSQCQREVFDNRSSLASAYPFLVPVVSQAAHIITKKTLVNDPKREVVFDLAPKWLHHVDTNGRVNDFTRAAADDLSLWCERPVSAALVKKIGSIPAKLATDETISLVLSNLQHLASLPLDCVPSEPRALIAFTKALSLAAPLVGLFGQDMGVVAKHAGASFKSDLDKIGVQGENIFAPRDYTQAVIGKIVLAYTARYAASKGKELHPETIGSCSRLEAGSILLAAVRPRSIVRMIEASQRWHSEGHQQNFQNAFGSIVYGGDDRAQEWPPLTQPVTAPNGYKLEPLVNETQLRREGKILGHCVGLYAWHCLGRNSHIISVQDETGAHRSTLELRDNISERGSMNASEVSIRIIQHEGGKKERAGSPGGREAVAWYVKQIASGKIDINVDEISKARSNPDRAQSDTMISQLIGYRPLKEDRADELYAVCRPYLPPKWQKDTLEKAAESFGIVEIVKNEVDSYGRVPGKPEPQRIVAQLNHG